MLLSKRIQRITMFILYISYYVIQSNQTRLNYNVYESIELLHFMK